MNKGKYNKGLTTVELLIAMAILGVTMSGAVIVTLGLPHILADGRDEEEASRIAADVLQKEFSRGHKNFPAVSSIASSTTNGVDHSLQVDLLPDGRTKRLTSIVSWADSEHRRRALALQALVTDFASAANSNICNSILAGDWTHPRILTYALTPGALLPASAPQTQHPITGLSLGTSTLVASLRIAAAQSDPKLFFFSLSSSTKPSYLGAINNAPSSKYGVADTAVVGSYLYIASAAQPNFTTCKASSSCSQLQIFDISNPAAPVLVTNYKLPTLAAPFAIGSGGQSSGKSIFVANGLVYLGLTKPSNMQGEEFNIIDVRNPRSPVWLDGYTVGRSINQILVSNGLAYLATDDPARELIVLDVRNPSAIKFVGSYDAAGSSTFGYGKTLALASTTLALGRTYTASGPEFILLDLSNPVRPLFLGSQQISSRTNPVSVERVALRDFLAFSLSDTAFQVWNSDDPTRPQSYAASFLLPGGETQNGAGLACRHNALYIASNALGQTGYLTVLTGS
jgi:type II secretory pathway pseudopilin PulG